MVPAPFATQPLTFDASATGKYNVVTNEGKDMFNLTSNLQPETNIAIFRQLKDKNMHQEANHRKDSATIGDLLRKVISSEFLIGGVLIIITTGIALTGPLVIRQILSFLKLKNPTAAQQTTAYWYANIWIGLFLLKIFIGEYADRLMFAQAVKAEEILTVQLFDKITRLSPSYRSKLSKGQLLSYVTVDVKIIFDWLRSGLYLFSAPITLIAVQVFLFKEIGADGLILLVLFGLAAIIHPYLNRAMSTAAKEKIAIMKNRMKFNIEVFSAIREVKTLGWEDVVVDKNRRFRSAENEENRRYFSLGNLYDLLINLTPVLTVLIVFLLELFFRGIARLDTVRIYTILSFIGMTSGPLKSLLNIMVNWTNGKQAFNRISAFLSEAEQVEENTNLDNGLQKGSIIVNSPFIGSWTPLKLNQQDDLEANSLIGTRAREFTLTLPNQLVINPGDRFIVMGESNNGKSSLLHAIMGNMRVIQGNIRFGGRIGYLPEKVWFKRASVRENVLFGLPYDGKKLLRVYRTVMMQQQLSYLPKGDSTVIKDVNNMTESQKKRIALARVLYSEPDILLLDSPFTSLDPLTATRVYQNLCREYLSQTILIVCNDRSIIRDSDNILILQDGKIMECGLLKELMSKNDSFIHRLMIRPIKAETKDELQTRRLVLQQRLQRQKKLASRRQKIKIFVKELLMMKKKLGAEKFRQSIEKLEILAEIPVTKEIATRVDPVPLWMYTNFFKSAPKGHYILLSSFLAQTVKILADWWIGSIKNTRWGLTYHQSLLIYAMLILLFGLLYCLGGHLLPLISATNAEYYGNKLSQSLVNSRLSWFHDQNNFKVASRLNRDNSEFFVLNGRIQNVFAYLIVFFATILFVGSSSPAFLLLAGAVLIIDIFILLAYTRVERELHPFGIQFTDNLGYAFEEIIDGIQTLRAFGRLKDARDRIYKTVYNFEVYKINNKYTAQGMTLLTELSSLVIVAGIVFFALSKSAKDRGPSELALIATSISLAVKLTGIMAKTVRDCVEVEVGMKNTVKKAYEIIDQNEQIDYDRPVAPEGWPADNGICFSGVTLRREGCQDILLSNANFEIHSGENVVLCGKGGKTAVLLSTCKILSPIAYLTKPQGKITIGGVDLQRIGRKFISRRVMLANEAPFIFSGSVRDNMDPREEKSDNQIRLCLQDVGLWDSIQIENESHSANITQRKLSHILMDAGRELTLGLQQKLNLARALLYKPSVLLCESYTSSLDQRTEKELEDVIRKRLPNTTIIAVTPQIETAVKSDIAINISFGQITEIGPPKELLKNPKTAFSRMVQKSDPELYDKMVSVMTDQKVL